MDPAHTDVAADAARPPASATNAPNLANALQFLERVVALRCNVHFGDDASHGSLDVPDLTYYSDASEFSRFIDRHQPSFDEYVVLLLALAPHVAPGALEGWIKTGIPAAGEFPEIGGSRDNDRRTLFPTAETAVFLLAGDDLDRRIEVQRLFTGDHWFAATNVLRLEPAKEGAPFLSGRLLLDPEHIELFTLGHISSPAFSTSFPAREITTERDWSELVLGSDALEQIGELKRWIEHAPALATDWDIARKIKPGYRALFHGPSGTGKTLTATLLGRHTGRKVFRIDLSTVISKYIGETESNLARLFDKACNKDWILFFDEADALFGKRTGVKDAHDRYANQEVSYLLQRVEDFDGLVILASNFKSNLDPAFLRRFNAIIEFPFPGEADREAIWRTTLPERARFENGADLASQLARFELTGGNIVNVVQHACLAASARGSGELSLDDALTGIRRETEKEGKLFTNVLQQRPG